MKVKKVLAVLLVFFVVCNLFVVGVKGVNYVDISNTITYLYVGNVLFIGNGDYNTVNNYTTLIGFTSGTVSIHIYNNSFDKTYNGVGLQYGNGKWLLFVSPVPSAGTYYIDMVANNLTAFDWSYVFNGHFYGKITIPSWGQGSINNYTPTFKLIYNNDYNYTSNKASFTMQYSNYSFNYFTLLNTDLSSDGALGGFHLLNYTISNNVVYCSFDNTYETMSNPHYLVYKVHGLDNSGNSLDFTGSVQFNINVDTSPKVKNYKVSYVMDGSPCLAGSGGGRLYLYIDYGSGYQLQDTSKWSVSISQIANGGQDTFSYAIDPNFNTAYKLSITKIDDIDTYNYSIHINDTGINLTGQLKVCSNDDYVFDNTGNETSGQETDIFTLLKEIKDIIIGFWNLLLSIIAFFGALFLAILNIVYSLGVAILSLLKIAFDFFASVSSIIFNRDTTYYSISTIANIPGSISYAGKNISLGGFLGQMDSVFRYIHDNIVLQYNGVWSLIAMIILIKRHLIKKDEDDND
jgi:hypothetical protein